MNKNRKLIQSFFKSRSGSGRTAALVNHQLGAFNDFIPHKDNDASWMQRVVNGITVGAVEQQAGQIRLELGDQEVIIKLGKVSLGTPRVHEANGSSSDSTPMMARLRRLTYAAPIYLQFTTYEDGIVIEEQEECEIGTLPVMVKSLACNLHRHTLTGKGTSDEEYAAGLCDKKEDPQDPGGYFIINGTERVLVCLEDLAPNRVMFEYEVRYERRT